MIHEPEWEQVVDEAVEWVNERAGGGTVTGMCFMVAGWPPFCCVAALFRRPLLNMDLFTPALARRRRPGQATHEPPSGDVVYGRQRRDADAD